MSTTNAAKYPKVTKGSIMARKVRIQCNKLTEAERQRHVDEGMRIVTTSAAKHLGRLGGKVRSEAKTKAARANAKKPRPRRKKVLAFSQTLR